MFSEESQTAEEESVTEEEDDEGDVEDQEKKSSVSWFLCSFLCTDVTMERNSQFLLIFGVFFLLHVLKTENKVAEVGEGAVWYRDLLQECPLPWVWGFPGQAVLLWDGLLQRGKSCGTGGGIRCDVITSATQTQHGLLNTWEADLDSVQRHRFITLQNTQSETCTTSQMMFCMRETFDTTLNMKMSRWLTRKRAIHIFTTFLDGKKRYRFYSWK